MYESSDEFDSWPDWTIDCGVSCHWTPEKIPIDFYLAKIAVAPFPQLLLIKSFSYLQVMMAYIRVWMSSQFGQIRSWTTQLAALEHLKIDVDPFLVSQLWL